MGYQVKQEIDLDAQKMFTLGFGPNQICVSCTKLSARKREERCARKARKYSRLVDYLFTGDVRWFGVKGGQLL